VDILNALCRQRVTRRSTSGVGSGDEPPTDSGSADVHVDRAHNDTRADATGEHRDVCDKHRDVCDTYGAAPSSARPAILVVADIEAFAEATAPDALANATAHLLWRTNHAPIELTPDAAQRLACDATLGWCSPTARSPWASAPHTPRSLRACARRWSSATGACRFAACAQPADRCDVHHLTSVVDGGATTLANLALLCRAHHRAVHEGGWTAVLHPDASMTFTHRASTLTSQPRAARMIQPHSPPPPGRPRRSQRRRQPDDAPRTDGHAGSGGAGEPAADGSDRDDLQRAGSAAPRDPLPF
jgi:hypothetical protein